METAEPKSCVSPVRARDGDPQPAPARAFQCDETSDGGNGRRGNYWRPADTKRRPGIWFGTETKFMENDLVSKPRRCVSEKWSLRLARRCKTGMPSRSLARFAGNALITLGWWASGIFARTCRS